MRKPYAFVGFGMCSSQCIVHGYSRYILDTFMSKTARLYRDTRTANAASSSLDKLNDDLHDVTRIMTKNMEELLWRGDSLDSGLFIFFLETILIFLFRNVPFVNKSSV